jgi:LysR family nitrogen assimilation transcriptional regulator
VIQVELSLVSSDNQPLSEPALAVHDLFLELVTTFDESTDGDKDRQ